MLKIFFFLIFLTRQEDENPEEVDVRKFYLNQYMKQFFSLDPEQSPFLAELRELKDAQSKQYEIDKIFGEDYFKIEDLIEQSRRYAAGLIIAEIKIYQNAISKYGIIFSDFYDMMNANVDPDTLSLNKENYTLFYGIQQSIFNEVFSRIKIIYQKYLPLREHVYKFREVYLEKIKELVKEKCHRCDFTNPHKKTLEKLIGKQDDEEVLNVDDIQKAEAKGEDIDKLGQDLHQKQEKQRMSVEEAKILNIFQTMKEPEDKGIIIRVFCGILFFILFQ